jgi:L-aspartate oxidase
MRYYYEAIIVGSGIAGLTAAINLKKAGVNVVVMTKTSRPEECNTYYAQGGIIASRKNDTAEKLKADVVMAGNDYNRTEAVDMFSKEGPELVFDFLINETGIEFSKNELGEIDYTEEAAHQVRRIVHYEDHTGDKIEVELLKYAEKLGIKIACSYTAVDIITNNHHSGDTQEMYRSREVMGIYALNNQTGDVDTFFAGAVILATGGLGNIYQYSTNPDSATGDGMSMANKAGADIINAEFVQFHPTSFFNKDIKRFLISEALRGEGARLKDHEGNEFMNDYSPLKDLAPRDVVARAIYDRMAKTGYEYMFLDLSNYYKGKIPIEKRFSRIYETCKKGGVDISKEMIPIVPAAHYFCGGVKVGLEGETSLKNLYAVGEVSCTGLHGSNRLASTSLLEGLLWGKKAADSIIKKKNPVDMARVGKIPDWRDPLRNRDFDPLLVDQDRKAIQLTMWNYAGIIRTHKGLERAKADLNYYSHRIYKFYQEAKLSTGIIELRNSVSCSTLIVGAAIRNKKSTGCHYIQ